MIERLAADGVVVAHFAFIAFVIAGGVLVLRDARWAALHLAAVAWATFAECTATVCPLTPLENRLRMAAGQSGYSGGFVEHYLLPVLYPDGLTAQAQRWIGIAVVLLNLAVYALVLARMRARRREAVDIER